MLAAEATSQTPAASEDTDTTTTEAAPAAETESDLTADSPAVGSNIAGGNASTGFGDVVLPLAGGCRSDALPDLRDAEAARRDLSAPRLYPCSCRTSATGASGFFAIPPRTYLWIATATTAPSGGAIR